MNHLVFVKAKLLDGAAVVHLLMIVNVAATFKEYADQVFVLYIVEQ